MTQPRRRRRPAGLWPEMDPAGTPVFDCDEEEWLGQGSSYELAGETAPDPDRVVAVLWLPTPDGTHLQHLVYGEMPYTPEPPRRPIGFRKISPDA